MFKIPLQRNPEVAKFEVQIKNFLTHVFYNTEEREHRTRPSMPENESFTIFALKNAPNFHDHPDLIFSNIFRF